MLIPRYYFTNDFCMLHDYFLTQPHFKKSFKKGEYLWESGELLTNVYYVEKGIVLTYTEHEDGYRKISSFHGKGTVFPGCHNNQYKIEQSIVSIALTDVEVLCFKKDDFYQMYCQNQELSALVLEWYAMYINLLLYENAHQEYNNSFIKLCNLLYLFSKNSPSVSRFKIELTQENIAEILTINRVNVARLLLRLRDEKIIKPHRKWIEIIDMDGLEAYCSKETLKNERE
ncbi:Crp/Fnr family transcriptional regulator [Thomasclavelia sp.]|uniref:Crp/Fnr family transcriptional regulator n=1 Tax=Thomasclavelia sp. TaxID=3025757 RepID=UPI0025F8BF34|nr:Crp/Fnr family transcriptional regulator [Thomasclavelia sp.]